MFSGFALQYSVQRPRLFKQNSVQDFSSEQREPRLCVVIVVADSGLSFFSLEEDDLLGIDRKRRVSATIAMQDTRMILFFLLIFLEQRLLLPSFLNVFEGSAEERSL